MPTFLKHIQQAENKKVLRNRLHLALQSFESSRSPLNIFSFTAHFNALQPFVCALSFAATDKAKFSYWFDRWLERVSTDLLDQRGEISAEVLDVLAQSQSDVVRIKQAGPSFTKYLVLSYCEHFMGGELRAYAHKYQPALRTWWDERLSALLEPNVTLMTYLNHQAENQWAYLCVIWRWMQYSLQFCQKNPERLFCAIESVFQAILYYLQRTQNLPFESEKVAVIVERLVKDAGYIFLENEVATAFVKLHYSFLCLTKSGVEHYAPRKMVKLLSKKPHLKEVAEWQSCIMAQFFILGVVLDYQEESSVNMTLLLQEHDFHPSVEEFLRKKTARLNLLRKLKDVLKMSYPDEHAALAHRIQQSIEHYQLLAYWLIYHPEKFPTLNEVAQDGMKLMFELDQQLQGFSSILAKMSWLKPQEGHLQLAYF